MTELILNMILIVFAVFGLYCLMRLTFDMAESKAVGARLSFTVASTEEIRALPDRFRIARHLLSVPGDRFCILIPQDLYEREEIQEELLAALLLEDAEILLLHMPSDPPSL
jgi:hypothetical protein